MADLRIETFEPAIAWQRTAGDSPDAGEPDCICTFCGLVIGAAEDDPRWLTHDEDECYGCELCEQPIRMWQLQTSIEMRFHGACFALVLKR